VKFHIPGAVVVLAAAACGLVPSWAQAQTGDAKSLKSPIPYTKKSIDQGRIVYRRYCTACHGMDGKSTVDVVADATDLTSPKLWKHGTAEGQIFKSIYEGAGETMPAFKPQIPNVDDMWHLVNYIRSLWPESDRPKLQDSEEKK
jgi:mono/diheme cytochrome c family protein